MYQTCFQAEELKSKILRARQRFFQSEASEGVSAMVRLKQSFADLRSHREPLREPIKFIQIRFNFNTVGLRLLSQGACWDQDLAATVSSHLLETTWQLIEVLSSACLILFVVSYTGLGRFASSAETPLLVLTPSRSKASSSPDAHWDSFKNATSTWR